MDHIVIAGDPSAPLRVKNMKTKTFAVNPFEMNCYVYYDESSREGVIIDPGAFDADEEKKISEFISESKIEIKFILNTHGHIDHIMGNSWAKKAFDVPLLIHKDDLPLIEKAPDQAAMFGLTMQKPSEPDKFIDEKDVIEFADTKLRIIHTPGHSPGSVCFIDEKEKIIFDGDVLFKGSIGRTDLWMGNMDTLLDSIRNKIMTYPDDYIVYPGHMDVTTVGDERLTNPFINGEFDEFNRYE